MPSGPSSVVIILFSYKYKFYLFFFICILCISCICLPVYLLFCACFLDLYLCSAFVANKRTHFGRVGRVGSNDVIILLRKSKRLLCTTVWRHALCASHSSSPWMLLSVVHWGKFLILRYCSMHADKYLIVYLQSQQLPSVEGGNFWGKIKCVIK